MRAAAIRLLAQRLAQSGGAGAARSARLSELTARAATHQALLREAMAARFAETAGRWPRGLFGRMTPRQEQLARAEAMGFDTSQKYYHGTEADIAAFRASRADAGDSFFASRSQDWRPSATYGPGVYMSKVPERTFDFAGVYQRTPRGGNIVPVFVRRGKFIPTIGHDGRVENPSDIRSIFAAFDPARAHESDLLAGIGALGVGVPLTGLALREALRERMT